MSKLWKIIVGVVLVMVTILVIGAAGFIFSRGRNFKAMARQPQAVSQLEVRLIDDNEDGIPDRGVIDVPPGRNFEPGFDTPRPFGRGFQGQGPGFDAPRNFGRRFAPGPGPGRFPVNRFGPFGIIGGLFGLAGLALFVGAIAFSVVLIQRWFSRPSAPDTAREAIEPPSTEPEPSEGEAALNTDEPEVTEPEDNRPES